MTVDETEALAFFSRLAFFLVVLSQVISSLIGCLANRAETEGRAQVARFSARGTASKDQ